MHPKTKLSCGLLTPIITVLLLTGCTLSNKDTLVATQSGEHLERKARSLLGDEAKRAETEQAVPASLAILPFDNDTETAQAPKALRAVLQGHLSTNNFQLVHHKIVDAKLDTANIVSGQRDRAMDVLGVDGVITGTVTEFERFYAGVYAHIKLGVKIQMWNRQQLLWEDSFEVTSRAGGVSASLWGNLLNAALASMHLDDENLFAVADELGRELRRVIPQPDGVTASAGPSIQSVLHNADKPLKYGDTLTIGLKGEAGHQASALIENVGRFPLSERQPGVYMADIPVSKNWHTSQAMVTGRLMDGNGGIRQWISPAGLIDFDNQPPEAVTGIRAQVSGENLRLSWSAATTPVAEYRIYRIDGADKQLLNSTDSHQMTLAAPAMFSKVQFAVTALDKAGNESQAVTQWVKIYPRQAMHEARVAEDLDGDITTDTLLSPRFSPYQLDGQVRVMADLYVLPDTVILVGGNGGLQLEADFYAFGNKTGPVRLRRAQDASPSVFLTVDTQGEVLLRGLKMSEASIGVDVKAGQVLIKNTIIEDSRHSGVQVAGEARVNIHDSLIRASHTSGLVVSGRAKIQIRDSMFEANQPFHIQNSSVYEVDAEKNNQWQPVASKSTVLGKVRY